MGPLLTVAEQAAAGGEAAEKRRGRGLRLGVVSYLNAAPLVHGLDAEPSFRVSRELPSSVADRLHRGELDLGTIPSIEYAAGEYAIVPGVAIASRGPVRSVKLYHRRPLAEVRSVALDVSSRTSVALARLLLRERLGRDPEYLALAPPVEGMLEAADAAVVIGDPALYYEGPAGHVDLGAEWTALTGLPFVWAFWAGRPGCLGPGEVQRLQRALREGVAAIPRIAAAWSPAGPPRAALNEDYLRRSIVYELGAAELAGLREFYGRACAAGLLRALPELRFL